MRKLRILAAAGALVAGLVAMPVAAQTIVAGQNQTVGNANITYFNGQVTIELQTIGFETFKKAHIYVGFEPVPTNGGGNPVPGRFPYKETFRPAAQNYTATFDAPSDPFECPPVYVAIHLEMSSGETAWVQGEFTFPGPRWGWFQLVPQTCGRV